VGNVHPGVFRLYLPAGWGLYPPWVRDCTHRCVRTFSPWGWGMYHMLWGLCLTKEWGIYPTGVGDVPTELVGTVTNRVGRTVPRVGMGTVPPAGGVCTHQVLGLYFCMCGGCTPFRVGTVSTGVWGLYTTVVGTLPPGAGNLHPGVRTVPKVGWGSYPPGTGGGTTPLGGWGFYPPTSWVLYPPTGL
jgi:hypothetical protein